MSDQQGRKWVRPVFKGASARCQGRDHVGDHRLHQEMGRVEIDLPVIAYLKQLLPVFYAVDISSLSSYFNRTRFEKATSTLYVRMQRNGEVKVCVLEEGKMVDVQYRKRENMVAMEALADVLISIRDRCNVGKLVTTVTGWPAEESAVMDAVLALENFTPSHVNILVHHCPEVEMFCYCLNAYNVNYSF